MARNVYLLISDMHRSAKKNANRVDYQHEIDVVDQQIAKCIQKYNCRRHKYPSVSLCTDRIDRSIYSAYNPAF